MFKLFSLFKEKEKEIEKVEIHNRLIDIRIGREYARGPGSKVNYACFEYTAEEMYERSIEKTDELTRVNKSYFIEGYDSQTEAFSYVVNRK